MGPIREDPAVFSETARVQAGGTQLEAATGFPAVNDLMRVEEMGGSPKKARTPQRNKSQSILFREETYEAWKTRDVSDLSWVIIVAAASRCLGAGTPASDRVLRESAMDLDCTNGYPGIFDNLNKASLEEVVKGSKAGIHDV